MNRKKNGKSIWGQSFSGGTLSCEGVNLSCPSEIDLRDHFAIEMMKIYLQKEVRSNFTLINQIKRHLNKPFTSKTTIPDFEKMARLCYQCADAMIRERDEKQQ